MKRKMSNLLAVVIMTLLLGGCQAMTGQTLGENIDDTTITTTVKAKLAAEKGSTLTRVGVDTNRGIVTLTGVVQSAADRALAERVARGVGGVKGVTNNLQIQYHRIDRWSRPEKQRGRDRIRFDAVPPVLYRTPPLIPNPTVLSWITLGR